MNFLLGFFIGIFISGGKREGGYCPQPNLLSGNQNYLNEQNLANQFQAQQMQFNKQTQDFPKESPDKGS